MERFQNCISNSTDKGFVFTSDALLGLIIAFLFIGLLAYNPFEKGENITAKMEGQRQVNDLLDLMDRDGTLKELDLVTVEERMDSFLGEQYDWKIIITEYKETEDSFNQTGTYPLGNITEDLSEKNVIKGNRIFLSFEGNKIHRYYISDYWVWLK